MERPAVRGDGVRVDRRGTPVLRGLDFTVAPATVTGLLGPSGSGKTTLLRAIIGVQRVTAGAITVLGSPAGAPALRAQLGYASQSAAVYDDLTVAQNLRYFAGALRAPHTDVARVLAAVELTGQAGLLVGRLSGGQRSRVSLAVAMLGRPRLLVLDEPTVGLDPVLREQLWSLFHRLADAGVSLLVSSHVMEEAERCDSLMLLRDGELLVHESPAALKARTGAGSLDQAFLRLVTEPQGAA